MLSRTPAAPTQHSAGDDASICALPLCAPALRGWHADRELAPVELGRLRSRLGLGLSADRLILHV